MKRLFFLTTAAILASAALYGQQSAPLKFKTIEVEDFLKHPKAEAHGYPRLSYKIRFTYPSEYGNKEVLATLQRTFTEYLLGKKYALLAPDKAVKACIEAWKKGYLEDTKEDPLSYEYICTDTILFVHDALLQMREYDYSCEGGAHGAGGYTAHLFNLQTGREYSRNDIFKPEAKDNIIQILTAELLKYWKKEGVKTSSFEKKDVWTENTDFAVTSHGIAFYYSQYALGMYPSVPADITIPFKTILPCLRQGTPVWELANSAAANASAPSGDMAALAQKIAAKESEINGLLRTPAAKTEHFISYNVQSKEVNGVLQIYRYTPLHSATDVALAAFTNADVPVECWLACYTIDRITGNITKTELPFPLPPPSLFDDEAFGEGGSYWRTEYTILDNGDMLITAAPAMSWICTFIVKWDKQSGFTLLPLAAYDSMADEDEDKITDNADMEKYVQNVIRANFQRINNIKNWFLVESKESNTLSAKGRALLTCYYSKSGLEKAVVKINGEAYERVIEYYLLHGRLSFIYDVTSQAPNAKTERRRYLQNDRCFRVMGENGKKLTPAQIEKEGYGAEAMFWQIVGI